MTEEGRVIDPQEASDWDDEGIMRKLPGSQKLPPKRFAQAAYVNARKEFLEMNGSIIKSAHIWRMTAFLCMFISLVAVMGVIYMGSRSHIVP